MKISTIRKLIAHNKMRVPDHITEQLLEQHQEMYEYLQHMVNHEVINDCSIHKEIEALLKKIGNQNV